MKLHRTSTTQGLNTFGSTMNDIPPSYNDTVGTKTHKEHSIFYFEDVYFEFDDTLYKFPKYYLKQSKIFERLFKRELSIREVRELGIIGKGTLKSPFVCLAVTEEMVGALLFVLKLTIFDAGPDLIWKRRWLEILEISCIWQMEKVTDVAISYLLKMEVDAVMKLELAKRYNIQHKAWRLSAIRELVRGNRKLTGTDTHSIGPGMAVKISRVQGMASEHPIISGIDRFFASNNVSWLDAYIHREFPDLF
ncbi:hypothetical protein AX15_001863 [Amanita polypyramis BW_CC]|nr:hypothetical protein AX15_001863 [Amanita polypyramis BW_CC]